MAQVINESIKKLVLMYREYQWVMIVGPKNVKEMDEWQKAHACENLHVMDFCHNIENWMAASDLVISRAGANSLAELEVLQKKMILIPLKNSAENHQLENAKYMKCKGLSLLVEEGENLSRDLVEGVKKSFENVADDSDMLVFKSSAGQNIRAVLESLNYI